MNWLLVGIVFYFILLVFVGVYYTKRAGNSMSHFLLGNRELPWWMAAISERASAMSGYWTLGYPGQGMTTGLATIFAGLGCSLVTFLNWGYLAARLRKLSGYYNALTLPDLINSRVRDDKGITRLVASLIIVIFMGAYLSSQLVAAGKVFEAVFGIPFQTAVIVGSIVILFYTLSGGFLAVCATDVIQGLLMMVVIVVLPVVGIVHIGGFGTMINTVAATDFKLLTVTSGLNGIAAAMLIIGFFAIGLPIIGQPHGVVRLMSVDNVKNIKKSTTVAGLMELTATYFAVLIGIVAVAVYTTIPDPEKAVFNLITDFIPPVIGGFFIAGILAAIMSTADSMLLVTVGELVENIYHKTFNKNAQEKDLVKYTRFLLVPITALAVYWAVKGGSVFWLVLYAYGGMGAAFAPVLIATLYWKGLTREGAIACMIGGMLSTILWRELGIGQYFFNIYAAVPCTLISTALMIVISWFTKPPEGVEEDFEVLTAPELMDSSVDPNLSLTK